MRRAEGGTEGELVFNADSASVLQDDKALEIDQKEDKRCTDKISFFVSMTLNEYTNICGNHTEFY